MNQGASNVTICVEECTLDDHNARSGKRATGMKCCESREDFFFFLLSPFATGQTALITAAESIGDLIHKIKGTMPDGSKPKGLKMERITKCW